MPDYLTRVAMAGARTGVGRAHPVRVTAALPPTIPHAAHVTALAVSAPAPPDAGGEGFEMTLDVPPAPPVPRPHVTERAAAPAAEPEEPVVRTEAAPAVSAGAPAPETPASEDPRPEAPVRSRAGARLLAPNTETHVVEMPRALRVPRIGLGLPRPKPPERLPEEAPHRMEEAAEEPRPAPVVEEARVERVVPRAESAASADAPRPARVEVTEAVPASRPAPVPEVRQPLVPRVQPAAQTATEAAPRAAAPPRNRITIGRLELQVRNVPPAPQPPVIVRAPQAPRPASSVLEGHFIERLPWKL